MKYININPKIMSGEPVITGTRIPISRIFMLLGEGYTFEVIQEQMYPHITVEQIKNAVIEATKLLGKTKHDQTSHAA